MKTLGYGQTDIGMRRENNEDCFLINEDLGLYVVCDGMGGHEAGEVAAREAAEAVCKFLDRRHASSSLSCGKTETCWRCRRSLSKPSNMRPVPSTMKPS